LFEFLHYQHKLWTDSTFLPLRLTNSPFFDITF